MICDSLRTDGCVIYNSAFNYIPCSSRENSALIAQTKMLGTIYEKHLKLGSKMKHPLFDFMQKIVHKIISKF